MPVSGFTYHRPLTDSNSTALSNFVVRVDLNSSNFDFTKARSDGADLRVRDETAGALVPIWLAEYDPVGQTARLYYRAVATGRAHALYFGNASATSVSAFLTANSGVFDHGSGFDSNFGDLSLANAGNGFTTQVPASSGTSDARNFGVWSLAELPTLQYSDTSFSDGLYTGVREMSLIRDATTNLPLLIGGKYYITFARRSASPTDKLDSAIASSTSQYGPWSTFSVFYDPPGAIRIGYPSTVMKVGSTYVCYLTYGWDVGGTTNLPHLSPYVMTSTDLVTWTTAVQALSPSIWTDPSSGVPCTDAGNPWVIRCADGTYFMLCEAYNSANTTLFWVVFGATATDPINGPWTAVNSGAALVSYGASGSWDAVSAANPKVLQLPNASYVLQYNGFADGTTGNSQHGFATATSRNGPWTKSSYNPMAGRFTPSYGFETSSLHYDTDGTSLLNYGQRFGDSGTGSSTAKIYRMQPILKRGGLVVSPEPVDAAAMGVVLAAGNFTAESRSSFTAHRATSATPSLLALLDYASVPAAGTSASFESQRRVEIFRWSHDLPQNNASGYGPGDITFVYWDSGGNRHYWNGSIWMAPGINGGRNLPADHGREVVARISDDGTNFIFTVVYGDNGSPIGSATIAKVSVAAFSSGGRVLMAGDPCTDSFAQGLYFRQIGVRPFASIEPAITVGASVQDQAITFTLTTPSPSSGPAGIASAPFTVTMDATYSGTVTITPSGGGLSTPTVLTFSSASPQTFTITPTLAGIVTLTATNSGGLTNPAPVTYTATPASPTTAQFPVITQAFTSARAAFMGYTIRDLTGAVVTARATAGIAFIGNAFVALAAVPRSGNFVVDWDDTLTHDTMLVADPLVDGTVTSSQALALILASDTSKTSDGGRTRLYAPDGTTVRFTGTVAGGDRVTSVLTPPV